MQMLDYFDPVLLCPDCLVVRTDRSRHCSFCNRCVERFDHHCPWINNCVGTGNHGWFALFLLSMYSLLITTTVVLLTNLDCYRNVAIVSENSFFLPLPLPVSWYTEWSVYLVSILCSCICTMFALPLTFLVSVQMKNLCLA